jgi:hypothetical protein
VALGAAGTQAVIQMMALIILSMLAFLIILGDGQGAQGYQGDHLRGGWPSSTRSREGGVYAASSPQICDGTRTLAASTPPDPDGLPAGERLHEVISLLAAGFLRSWLARAVDGGEKDLDVLRTPSDVCPQPRSEGESL